MSVALSGNTVAVSAALCPSSSDRESSLISTPVTDIISGAAACTVISQAAVKPPSSVVTVILAWPSCTAVTVPSLSTVATLFFEELHLTPLLSAFAGDIVAVRVAVCPTVRVKAVLSREMPVTATFPGLSSGLTSGLSDGSSGLQPEIIIERTITKTAKRNLVFFIASKDDNS